MKRVVFIIIGFAILAFFYMRKTHENVKDESSNITIPQRTPVTVVPTNKETVSDPNDKSSRAEAIQLTQQFVSLMLERKHMNELAKSNHERQDPTLKRELKEERRGVEIELTELLSSSSAARQQYTQMVTQERDPYVQRQLVSATHRLDSGFRTELAIELTKSDDSASRKIGVETLPLTGTQQAFNQLSQISNQDADVSVQTSAVKSLSRFGLERNSNEVQPSNVNQTLRDLAKSQADPSVRETAFRGLIGRGSLSTEDRELIWYLAENETDPKIRELAISSQKALSARRN